MPSGGTVPQGARAAPGSIGSMSVRSHSCRDMIMK